MAKDDSHEAALSTCTNGHRMLIGSTICPVCSAPVGRRRPARGRRDGDHANDETPGFHGTMGATPARMKNPRQGFDATTGTGNKARAAIFTGAAVVLVGVAAAAIFAVADPEPEPTGPTPLPQVGEACGGAALEQIELDREYKNASKVVCFEVETELIISMGATPADPSNDLVIEISNADGAFWAAADDTHGDAPEVSSPFFPGTYVATVTAFGGGDPGEFTLYSTTHDPDAIGDPSADAAFNSHLPGVDECGSADIPMLTDTASVKRDSDNTVACLVLTEAAWTKIGVISLDEVAAGIDSPDLTFALHKFDETGRPRFVRSFDDAFGSDPEASTQLEVGTYLIEVEEWSGGATGMTEIYVDTERSYFRVGPVADNAADLTAATCEDDNLDTPIITIGETATRLFLDEDAPDQTRAIACLTVSDDQILSLSALSLEGQDLVLEVVKIGGADNPMRYAWSDDYIFVQEFTDKNPKVETVIPAGTYVLVVSEFFGDPLENLQITVAPFS